MNHKKRRIFALLQVAVALLISLISFTGTAQTVTLPRLSPQASVTQTIGISIVTIKYSRPSVKQRKIWGEVVPFGLNVQTAMGPGNPSPWRAGADENTTISFSHDTKVEGINVPAGTYGLFFIINEDNSGEVILSKNQNSWGSFFYNPAEDQLRAKIKIRDNAFTELLTYDFINITKNNGEIVLNWEKKQFPVKISYAVNEIVMANAKEELKGAAGFGIAGYISAAYYALQNNINTEQGLIWINKALEHEPTNYEAIWVKSRYLFRDGKSEEAEKMIKESMEKASENDISSFGNLLLGLSITDRSIKIFLIYTERYPKSANAWYYLGEGYFKKGDKENAIKSYKKSLTLSPANDTKVNATKKLKELGAL